ncbi:MAG: DUF4831 family protein [Rikenellaceae bacterium]
MNKIILNIFTLGLVLLASTVVTAQTSGLVQKINTPYILPQTGVKVVIKVAHEKIEKGPYAKYSQQLLGVTAPLSDRESYTILSGALSSYTEGDASNIYSISDSKVAPLEVVGMEMEFDNAKNASSYSRTTETNTPTFSDMSITPIVGASYAADRTSSYEKSMDDMAKDAANTIFTLRKRRFDLITGESLEGAFGAGLGAAIEEMKRIEDEYISLFVGKKTVEIRDYVFDVVPKVGAANYVVCRFTKEGGIVDAMDVSGEPVLLVINPDGKVKSVPSSDKKTVVKGTVSFRAADMSTCKLFDNSQKLLETRRLPILQFGAVIDVEPVR